MTEVCEVYGYRLEHFYQRSFKEGGVTRSQLLVLFETAQKREIERRRFYAAVHGAKMKGATSDNKFSSGSADRVKEDPGFMFGDPESYKSLPMDERKALTEKMMGAHKKWGQSPLGVPDPNRIKWA